MKKLNFIRLGNTAGTADGYMTCYDLPLTLEGAGRLKLLLSRTLSNSNDAIVYISGMLRTKQTWMRFMAISFPLAPALKEIDMGDLWK